MDEIYPGAISQREYTNESQSESGESDSEHFSDLSGDIRDDLEDIMGDCTGSGSFSFSCTYPDAPNPVLEIDGLGLIGVPLSTRDAVAIKACAEQAPFGMGTKTVVDKTVRDTWEIDAKRVRFRNTAWQQFLQKAVQEVCSALGVNPASSAPRCDPYKLLLYETGSHFLPHVDSEKTNGMFATMIIVLPSPFSGGAVNVSHGSLSVTYDCAPQSLFSTSVLAWYTDVKHEVQEITSGYRLALSFNLVHMTNSLRPAVQVQTERAERLRRVLLSWKKNLEGSPAKILFLLDHKYSQAGLCGSALKGSDAQNAALLHLLAEQVGFQLGLAIVECHVSGAAEADLDSYHWDGSRRPEYISMVEELDSDMSVKHLVDLNGKLIARSVKWKAITETIPAELEEEIKEGEHDEEEYEGYTGNAGATVERWYRATVLVIWPNEKKYDIMFGPQGLQYACQRVQSTAGQRATSEEQELVDYILAHPDSHSAELEAVVVKSTCTAAAKWKDLNLWYRVFKLWNGWKNFEKNGQDIILNAVEVFGFDKMCGCISGVLESGLSNPASFGFLDALEGRVASQSSADLASSATRFLALHREFLSQMLKPPKDGEASFLLSLADRFGGIQFLQSPMLVQIRDRGTPYVMIELAEEIHRTKLNERDDATTWTNIIDCLTVTAISNFDFFGPFKVLQSAQHTNVYWQPRPNSALLSSAQAHLLKIRRCINICLATKNQGIVGSIMLKLADLRREPADVARMLTKDVLLPILAHLGEQKRLWPVHQQIPKLDIVCMTVVDYVAQEYSRSSVNLVQPEICKLMKVLIEIGQQQIILSRLVPKVEALASAPTSLRPVLNELINNREHFPFASDANAEINTAIARLAKQYATTTPLPLFVRPVYPSGYVSRDRAPSKSKEVAEILECCLRASCPDAYLTFIKRMVQPRSSMVLDVDYIQDNLIPLIPELRYLATKYRSESSWTAFTSSIRAIMLVWARRVLGQKPADATSLLASIRKWTCSCDICPQVRQFLQSMPERSKSWHRIGAPKRRHVENFIQLFARSAATYSTISGSPQGLMVTKSDSIYLPVRWPVEQKKGLEILKTISNDAKELQRILGEDYIKIVDLLNGRPESATVHGVASTSSTSTSSGYNRDAWTSYASTSALGGAMPGFSVSLQPTQQPTATVFTSTSSESMPTANVTQEPPRKRKKMAYDENGVIDLT